MIALSVSLPDDMAKASQQVAKELGMSRTQFIRLSVAHELERVHKKIALREMIKGFKSMQDSPDYLQNLEELEEGFNDNLLPEEMDEWWKKKS